MRAGKVGRLVVRAVVVGLLTLFGWLAATSAAHATWEWNIGPADGNSSTPEPTVSSTR